MKYLYLCLIVIFTSCNKGKIKQLQADKVLLEKELLVKNTRIDSFKTSASIQFEKLLKQDVLADALRSTFLNEFIPLYQLKRHKTKDSTLIEAYLLFAKNNKTSYLSTYAIDRIKDIKDKQSQIKVNDLVGEWQWESITNLIMPFKEKLNWKLVFTKNKKAYFYKNNTLVWEDTFVIPFKYGNIIGNEVKFKKQGYFLLNLKENNILTLTKGRGICMDCGTHIYRKTKEEIK